MIADTAALWADPIFDAAATGAHPGFFLRLVGRDHLHSPDLFRFFRLFGHGDRRGADVRHRPAPQLLFAVPLAQHRRVVEPLAYDAQPVGTGLYFSAASGAHGSVYRHPRVRAEWTGHSVGVLLPLFLSMLTIGVWHGP